MNKLMNLLADATATGAAEVAAEEMSTGAMIIYSAVQFLPMILIFVIFYFMLIRPQRKKDKEAKRAEKKAREEAERERKKAAKKTVKTMKKDIEEIFSGDKPTEEA